MVFNTKDLFRNKRKHAGSLRYSEKIGVVDQKLSELRVKSEISLTNSEVLRDLDFLFESLESYADNTSGAIFFTDNLKKDQPYDFNKDSEITRFLSDFGIGSSRLDYYKTPQEVQQVVRSLWESQLRDPRPTGFFLEKVKNMIKSGGEVPPSVRSYTEAGISYLWKEQVGKVLRRRKFSTRNYYLGWTVGRISSISRLLLVVEMCEIVLQNVTKGKYESTLKFEFYPDRNKATEVYTSEDGSLYDYMENYQ